eukprot:133093_1
MLKSASLTIFVLYTLSSVIYGDDEPIIGSAGQDCTPDDDDVPELCYEKWQWVTERKVLECSENFDCCLCGALRCTPKCDAFKANGDSAAYYVPKIIIDGNSDSGADIDCDGDSSCEGVKLTGTNIKGVKCGGDRSCFASEMNIKCLDPCKVECDGDRACKNANLWIKNVESMSCGDRACEISEITLVNPDDDFQLECGAERSCRGANIKIVVNGDKNSKLKNIDCGSKQSCQGASITIKNTGTAQVVIEEINCESEQACRWATFKTVGNVKVKSCDCETDNDACLGATFNGFKCTGAP